MKILFKRTNLIVLMLTLSCSTGSVSAFCGPQSKRTQSQSDINIPAHPVYAPHGGHEYGHSNSNGNSNGNSNHRSCTRLHYVPPVKKTEDESRTRSGSRLARYFAPSQDPDYEKTDFEPVTGKSTDSDSDSDSIGVHVPVLEKLKSVSEEMIKPFEEFMEQHQREFKNMGINININTDHVKRKVEGGSAIRISSNKKVGDTSANASASASASTSTSNADEDDTFNKHGMWEGKEHFERMFQNFNIFSGEKENQPQSHVHDDHHHSSYTSASTSTFDNLKKDGKEHFERMMENVFTDDEERRWYKDRTTQTLNNIKQNGVEQLERIFKSFDLYADVEEHERPQFDYRPGQSTPDDLPAMLSFVPTAIAYATVVSMAKISGGATATYENIAMSFEDAANVSQKIENSLGAVATEIRTKSVGTYMKEEYSRQRDDINQFREKLRQSFKSLPGGGSSSSSSGDSSGSLPELVEALEESSHQIVTKEIFTITAPVKKSKKKKIAAVSAPSGEFYSPFEACNILYWHHMDPMLSKPEAMRVMIENKYIPVGKSQIYRLYRQFKQGEITEERQWGRRRRPKIQ